MSETIRETDQILRQVKNLPWVVHVETTEYTDATHKLITEHSVIKRLEEIHTLQNLGVTVEAYSQTGHYGISIYATIP